MAQKPIRTKTGTVGIVDSTNFPVAKMIAAGLVEVEPGGMRELHWHPNSDELQYYIENTGTTKLRYLELWQSDHFEDLSLAQWLAFTPYELVKAHLNIDKSVLSQVSTQKAPVV